LRIVNCELFLFPRQDIDEKVSADEKEGGVEARIEQGVYRRCRKGDKSYERNCRRYSFGGAEGETACEKRKKRPTSVEGISGQDVKNTEGEIAGAKLHGSVGVWKKLVYQ